MHGLGIACHSTDSDECKLSLCSQKCINTPGSFRCSCRPGYILDVDHRSCILGESVKVP